MTLTEYFKQNPRAALGLSGGVDSAYLLWAGLAAGALLRPYFVKTPFQPEFELWDAQTLCQKLGVQLTVIRLDVLAQPGVVQNPPDRCYYCKKALFAALAQQAAKDGFSLVLDGTNASDNSQDRPGMRALAELRVESPLRLCGITKAQVRAQAKKAGIALWNKPAYACLATRVPTGTELTRELLHRIEKSEDILFSMGFTDFRVRVFCQAARLQFPAQQWQNAAQMAVHIQKALEPYFKTVLLDLEPRKTQGG